MVILQPLVSEFTIVSRLEDFVTSSKGRIEYLSLSTKAFSILDFSVVGIQKFASKLY